MIYSIVMYRVHWIFYVLTVGLEIFDDHID